MKLDRQPPGSTGMGGVRSMLLVLAGPPVRLVSFLLPGSGFTTQGPLVARVDADDHALVQRIAPARPRTSCRALLQLPTARTATRRPVLLGTPATPLRRSAQLARLGPAS